MSNYLKMSHEQLQAELNAQMAHLEACRNQNLKLNMARGKPAKQQLDAVSDILSVITTGDECFDGNLDTRNYGELAGIPSARAYWAEVLGCKPEQTFIGGSASLNLMFDVIAKAYSAPQDFPSLYVPVRVCCDATLSSPAVTFVFISYVPL